MCSRSYLVSCRAPLYGVGGFPPFSSCDFWLLMLCNCILLCSADGNCLVWKFLGCYSLFLGLEKVSSRLQLMTNWVLRTLLALRWENSVMSFILQTAPWDQAEAISPPKSHLCLTFPSVYPGRTPPINYYFKNFHLWLSPRETDWDSLLGICSKGHYFLFCSMPFSQQHFWELDLFWLGKLWLNNRKFKNIPSNKTYFK